MSLGKESGVFPAIHFVLVGSADFHYLILYFGRSRARHEAIGNRPLLIVFRNILTAVTKGVHMMSDQASKDEAAKARIVAHMNADHHDSVVRYLEHFHSLSGYQAYDGKISDVSLTHIAFKCGGKEYRTALEPPMTSFREARERLVQMDKDCVGALDRSDITVKEYIAPTGLYLALFVIVSTTFVAFSSRSNFERGGYVSAVVPAWFAGFCWTVQPFVLYPMLVIHALESWHMARGRLRKHNVNVRNPVWWQWMGTTFIEGVGSYNRFDKMIRKKRAEKEKQKH